MGSKPHLMLVRSFVGQFASLLTENYRNRNLIRVNTVISRREEATVRGRRANSRFPRLEREALSFSFPNEPGRVFVERLVSFPYFYQFSGLILIFELKEKPE